MANKASPTTTNAIVTNHVIATIAGPSGSCGAEAAILTTTTVAPTSISQLARPFTVILDCLHVHEMPM